MSRSSLWIEKYRPSKLSDIPVKDNIVEDLEGFVRRGSIPHMVFSGPQGSGKAMSVRAVAKELYGKDYEQYFLKVSCTDEGVMVRRKPFSGEGGGEIQKAKRRRRGAGTNKRLRLRKEILDHIQSPPMGEAPHKILYLLNFDKEDSQTQNALRRPMETYSDKCRFLFSVENLRNIIQPLLSRCTVIRFGRPSEDKIRRFLSRIENNENVVLKKDGFKAIMNITQGDVAQAVNLFQSASIENSQVDKNTVYNVSKSSREESIGKMINNSFHGDFKEARKYLLDLLIKEGVDPRYLLREMQEEVLSLDAPKPVKIKLVEKIGDYDFDLTQSSNERIQLENFLTHIARIGERLRS